LEARRFQPTGAGAAGKASSSADAEARRKAMSAAAEARNKAHKNKTKPMKTVTKTTLAKQKAAEDVNNFTSEELQPQTEASRQAAAAAKKDEQNLAAELGYNPYEAAKSTAGQARSATVTTQHGEIAHPDGGSIPVVAPPVNPTSAAVDDTERSNDNEDLNQPLPDDFEAALATVVSSNADGAKNGLKIARTLIVNATTKGQGSDEEASAKFRKVRLANPKIKKAIVDVPGNFDLLTLVGFQLATDDATDENLLVFPPGNKGPEWLPTALAKMEKQEKALVVTSAV